MEIMKQEIKETSSSKKGSKLKGLQAKKEVSLKEICQEHKEIAAFLRFVDSNDVRERAHQLLSERIEAKRKERLSSSPSIH